VRAGPPLVMGDMAWCVQCGVGAPFQAVVSDRWRGVGDGRLMRWRYSATDHIGYRAAIIASRAWGLHGRGAQLSAAAKSPAFNAVDLGPLR